MLLIHYDLEIAIHAFYGSRSMNLIKYDWLYASYPLLNTPISSPHTIQNRLFNRGTLDMSKTTPNTVPLGL